MGFHNTRIATNLSRGSSFGPGFNNRLIELQSGQHQATSKWGGGGKRRYNLAYAIRKPVDLAAVRDFYIARNGALHTWRLKDWEDYATSPSGTTHNPSDSAVSNTDVTIGTGDGSTTQFQLFKRYVDDVNTTNRTIEHPVESTVTVAVDGVAQVRDTDYSVNDTTGIITFGTAPGDTLAITAGFEFDVEARFGPSVGQSLDIDLDEFNLGSITSIDVIEELPGSVKDPEMAWHGWAKDHGTQGSPVTITLSDGRLHAIAPSVAGLNFILPDITNMPEGGPVFAVSNDSGSNTLDIMYSDNATTVVTVAAGGFVELWVVPSGGGLKAWQSK